MSDPMCFICESIELLQRAVAHTSSFSIGDVVVEANPGRSNMRWVRIRARGADWSWLTPDEAVAVGRHLIERYGKPA